MVRDYNTFLWLLDISVVISGLGLFFCTRFYVGKSRSTFWVFVEDTTIQLRDRMSPTCTILTFSADLDTGYELKFSISLRRRYLSPIILSRHHRTNLSSWQYDNFLACSSFKYQYLATPRYVLDSLDHYGHVGTRGVARY